MQVQNVGIRTDDLVHSKRLIILLRYKRAPLGDICCLYKILIHWAGQQRGAVARFSLARAPGPGTAGPPARLSRPVPCPCALLSRPGPGPQDGGTASMDGQQPPFQVGRFSEEAILLI